MTNTGLYIHIPFCKKKCNYCNFYSDNFTYSVRQRYVDKLCEEIEKWGRLNTCPIDTIYLGGGTPSLLSRQQLSQILSCADKNFILGSDTEITCEVNPDDKDFIVYAAKLGINRISIGVQSSDDKELELLGRRHSFEDAKDAVKTAKKNGVNNVSADIMIGLPESSINTVSKSLADIISMGVEHISAYILKVEDNTPFGKAGVQLPDDDRVADQYLFVCRALENAGYEHYEISNFAKPGYQSRHNNKYWNCEEYIGIGPSAHSFFGGKRFYYPDSLEAFLNTPVTVDDGVGGQAEEYIMLCLRLSKGLVFSEFESRFGKLPSKLIKKAGLLKGLCIVDDKSIRLTDQGMLVSNNIITELVEEL